MGHLSKWDGKHWIWLLSNSHCATSLMDKSTWQQSPTSSPIDMIVSEQTMTFPGTIYYCLQKVRLTKTPLYLATIYNFYRNGHGIQCEIIFFQEFLIQLQTPCEVIDYVIRDSPAFLTDWEYGGYVEALSASLCKSKLQNMFNAAGVGTKGKWSSRECDNFIIIYR